MQIISQYQIYIILGKEEHDIALIINTMIRSIFSFRFGKENPCHTVIAYLSIFNAFIEGCRDFDVARLDFLGSNIIKSCYKHLIGYYVSANFDPEGSFEETLDEEEDSRVPKLLLEIMNNFYELLSFMSKGENEGRIIESENAGRNKMVLGLLFPKSLFDFNNNKVSLMCMVFVTLQSLFEHLDELETEHHRECLGLIEKFVVLLVGLCANCERVENIHHCLREIQMMYLNVLSFLEIKFYQYFYFEVPVQAKATFDFENKLRHNAHLMKEFILDVFFTILELLKELDEMDSKQHKSFFELFPSHKNSSSQEPKLCLLFNLWLKGIDDKVIEFYYISNLRDTAREKLAAFLLQRKISRASTEYEKLITLSMQKFTAQEKTDFLKIEKKSLKGYQDKQKEYYKVSKSFEERINSLMLEYRAKHNIHESKRLHDQEKARRAARKAQICIWETARLY